MLKNIISQRATTLGALMCICVCVCVLMCNTSGFSFFGKNKVAQISERWFECEINLKH